MKFNVNAWTLALRGYPNQRLRTRILSMVSAGTPIYFSGDPSKLPKQPASYSTNKSDDLPVLENLVTDMKLGRKVFFPKTSAWRPKCIAPLYAIPKDKIRWRIISNFSHCPRGHASLNDGIPDEFAHVAYPKREDIARLFVRAGATGAFGRIDLKDAYRQIAIAKNDIDFLGYCFHGFYGYEAALPFGVRSACQTFQMLGESIIWICEDRFLPPEYRGWIVNYLDDFIYAHSSVEGSLLLRKALLDTFSFLRVAVNLKKSFGPAHTGQVLGYVYNLRTGRCHISKERERSYLSELHAVVLSKPKCTRAQLESLLGKYEFAVMACWPAKCFLWRLRKLSLSVKRRYHHIRISSEAKKDATLLCQYFSLLNTRGVSTRSIFSLPESSVLLETDACETGIGAIWCPKWCYALVPQKYLSSDIATKELAAVTFAFHVFGNAFEGRKIRLRVDSSHAAGALINKRDPSALRMHFVRVSCLLAIKFRFFFWVERISSKENAFADALSRHQFGKFHSLCRGRSLQIDAAPLATSFCDLSEFADL